MSSTTSNQSFKKIHDTAAGLSALESLVQSGIIPASFKVISGTVSIAGVGVGAEVAVLDTLGDPLQLTPGQHIMVFNSFESVAETGGARVQFGLSATDGGVIVDALTVIGAADVLNIPGSEVVTVGANVFLVAEVTTAAGAAGVADVIVVVA